MDAKEAVPRTAPIIARPRYDSAPDEPETPTTSAGSGAGASRALPARASCAEGAPGRRAAQPKTTQARVEPSRRVERSVCPVSGSPVATTPPGERRREAAAAGDPPAALKISRASVVNGMKGTGMLIRTLAAAALGIVSVVPIAAHHSFSAHYLEDQSVSLEGTVKEFQYRSPHAMLVFTAPAPAGRTQTYAAEWANPNRLNRQGITQDTLKPGEDIMYIVAIGRKKIMRV